MAESVEAPEVAIPPVEVEASSAPEVATTETPTAEEPITEADLQALIDKVLAEVEIPKEEVPVRPQFPSDTSELSQAIVQLDELVDKTVALEEANATVVAEKTTLEAQINELQQKVDFVDTAFEKISSVLGEELAQKLAVGETEGIPLYYLPGKMEAVLGDKVLGPLVQKALEGQPIDIPKFLGEIVASRKASLPNIKSDPIPVPKTIDKTDLTKELAKLSNQGF